MQIRKEDKRFFRTTEIRINISVSDLIIKRQGVPIIVKNNIFLIKDTIIADGS